MFSLSEKIGSGLVVLTPRKLYNSIMSGVQRSLKHSTLLYRPTRISIETGNICNLRCPLCPTGRKDPTAQRGFMSFENYRSIIDELHRDLVLVRLYNWGEPLLNKGLIPMIAYAAARRIAVTVSTNLNILDRDTAGRLLDAGPAKIFISCDGASETSYNAYHIGGCYHTVMKNMELLVEEKKKRSNCRTRIIWLFHVFRPNEHEVDAACAAARNLGIEIRINKMRTDMGKEIFETADKSIERDREWIPEDPRYCAFDLEKKQAKQQRNFCALPWKETVINWDGAVLPCCSVYQEKYSFGNAFEKGFASIWNGGAYRSARQELAGKSNTMQTVCHICKTNGFTYF